LENIIVMSQKQQSLRQSLLVGSIAGFLIGGASAILQKDIKPALILGGIAGTTGTVSSLMTSGTKTKTTAVNPPDNILSSPPLTPPTPNQIAVFWDYENVKIPSQSQQTQTKQNLYKIVEYIETQGNPAIKNVYSKWSRENQNTQQIIDKQGFNLIHVSSPETNSVDIRLIVDCLSTVYRLSHISKFIIFTNDNDYVELANTLRQLNKTVIIVGHKNKIGKALKDNADEAITIESLIGSPEPKSQDTIPSEKPSPNVSYADAVQYLLESTKTLQQGGKVTSPSMVNEKMCHTYSDYQGYKSIQAPNTVEFEKFKTFLKQAEKDGFIQIEKRVNKRGKSQEVITISKTSQSSQPIVKTSEPIKTAVEVDKPENSKFELSYDEGVVLLLKAIEQLNNEQKKATLKRLGGKLKELAKRNKKVSFQRKNGAKFSNLTKFIKAVEQDGKVKMQRLPNSEDMEVKLVETPTLELLSSPVKQSA